VAGAQLPEGRRPMKKYEIVLLLDPTIEDSEVENSFNKVLEIITAQGAAIIEGETVDWGKRKLAFPLKKKENAFYRIYHFNSEPAAIEQIERRLRINDLVLRSLVVIYDPNTERSLVKPVKSEDDEDDE
jgi:small subunit ribosomal protein S6